jgi:guanosine-3',5'-bis(diphosphate) 3'-pyrophosphohydrolase
VEDTETSPKELGSRYGEEVRRLVLEVTDDKSLAAAERKQRQVESAASLSPGATMIRVADKISNIRNIADRPPQGWSLSRVREYLDWAEAVGNNCPQTNPALEKHFREVLNEGRRHLTTK